MDKAKVQVKFFRFACIVLDWFNCFFRPPYCPMTKHPLILQTHKCHRVDGDHRPGFDCLDDLQVINLMLYLDVDSLINLGKASERLYHLVCDKKVWRSLLKRVEDFTTERVQQLTVFLEKSSSSQEMRQEVLREAARRLHEQVAEGSQDGVLSVHSRLGQPFCLSDGCWVTPGARTPGLLSLCTKGTLVLGTAEIPGASTGGSQVQHHKIQLGGNLGRPSFSHGAPGVGKSNVKPG